MDLNKMLNLTGMVALVTGGGNGIGCGSVRILWGNLCYFVSCTAETWN